MGLSARRSQRLRARSRATVSLVVIAAWFGTLLVAAPTASPAAAAGAPASPTITDAPASPGNAATPTWTITVDPDVVDDVQPPVFNPATSDTSTATITVTHAPECSVTSSGAPSYQPCTATSTAGTFTFTPTAALTADATVGHTDYTFYARDVVTTTTSTMVEDATGTQTGPSVTTDGPTPSGDVSRGYRFDDIDPDISLASAPSGLVGAGNGWTFTSTDSSAVVSCSISGGGPSGPCGPSADFPGISLADGDYTVTATATDVVGNTGTTTTTYHQDTTGPVLSLAAGPTGRGNDTTPDWRVTADGNEQVDCSLTLDGNPFGTPGRCDNANFPVALGADGTYVLTATATDGTTPTTLAMGTYVLDTAAPVISIGAVDASTPTRPRWSVGVSDAESGLQGSCRLTGTGGYNSGVSSCGSTYVAPVALAEGTYTLTVTVTDTAGNPATASSAAYTYDITAPRAPVLGGDSGFLRSGPISWTATPSPLDSDFDHLVCVVTPPSGPPATTNPCSSPLSIPLAASAEGTWTLSVTAVDATGNAGPAATRQVIYDHTLNAPVVGAPAGPAKQPVWNVSVDPDATATCSVAGVTTSATDCTNTTFTVDLSNKPGGLYILAVDAVDAAGNTASTTADYVLPPDAPTVSVAAQGRSLNPAWTIAAQSGATLACTLVDPSAVAGPAFTCATGTITPDLTGGANGTWNLEVVATVTTAKGPVSSAVGTTANGYLLDTIGPGAPTISGTPAGTQKSQTASWTITPAAGTTRVDCEVFHDGALDRVVPSCETGGVSLTFASIAAEGAWQVKATAFDQVDNPSTVVPGPVVVFDMTPPTAPDIQPLASPSNNPSPTWTITHDSDATIECAWTTGGATPTSWFACATPQVIAVPAPANDGTYTLHARATDTAGNISLPDSQDYELDRAKPAAPTFSTPTSPSSSGDVSWNIGTGTEVNPTIECRLLVDDGTGTFVVVGGHDWGPCTSPFALTLPAENGYRAQARVTDRAGNLGPVGTSTTYLFDKTPPQVPGVSGPTGPSQTQSVTWAITPAAIDGGTGLQCRYVDNGVELGSFISCGTTVTRSGLGDGSYALEVQAVDDAGNISPTFATSPTYVVDNAGPAAPTFAGANGTGKVTSTTWDFTGETGATARCLLYLGSTALAASPSLCTTGTAYPLNAGDGAYRLEVFFVDAAGNNGTAAFSPTYLLDTAPPAKPDLHGPTGVANNASARYVFTSEAGSLAQCRLLYTGDRTGTPQQVGTGSWTACTSPWDVPLGLGDGLYQAEVHVTDAAGNVSPDAQSEIYELDTTGPVAVTFTAQPTGTDNDPAVHWDWSGETPSTGTCTLRRTPVGSSTAAAVIGPVPCNGQTFAADLTFGDGFYQLFVQLTDPQSNAGAVAASTGYTLDLTPPGAPTVSGPTGTSNVTKADYDITSAVEAGATAECKLTRDGTIAVSDWGSCSLPRSIMLVDDGSYVLQVRLTDQYGNTGAVGSSPAYLLDTLLPAKPDLHGPTGVAKNADVTYVFTSETGSRPECRLLYVAGNTGTPQQVGTGSWTACASPWSVTLGLGDGLYQAEVRVTDAAGNVSPVASSEIYELDTTGPLAATFTAQPTGTANGKDVTWTWTGETPTTGVCRLLFTPVGGTTASVVAGPLACDSKTYGTTLTSGDGFYQLTVQLTDPSQNAGAVATSTGYTLDTTPPPAPTVSGPSGTSNKTNADYALVGPIETPSSAECRLTRDTTVVVSDWGPCTMPRTITLAGDGSYVLQVRLTDQYGNTGPAGASPAYLLDTKLPNVPTVTAPSSPSANGAPLFTIVTDSDTTTTCRLSRGSVVAAGPTTCTGSFTGPLTGQPDGDYVLEVIATDPAGNTATGTSTTYTYDTTKPIAPVVTGPAGPSQTRNPVFSWTGEAGSRPECSLQEKAGAPGAWTSCATPYAPSLATDGSWVLSVRLIDAAGNVSDPGQSGAYLLDTTPPATPAVTAPPSPGRDLAPSWSAATEEGSRTDCRLSGPGQLGSWGPCTLPVTTPISGDGTYTFEVRATDAAGNVSQTGAATYALDTTAPPAPVVVQPASPGRSRTPSVTFTAEAGTTGSCKLSRGSTVLSDSAACSSPTTLNLTGLNDGAYTLSVRAVDAAGNIGPAGTATYVLDTTAPAAPTMTLVAGSPSSDRAPQFGFNVELGTTPSCKVTLPSGVVRDLTCTNTATLDLSGAGDGDYVLNVRATDPAGNVSAPATTTYHLDSNAPVAPRVVGPTTPGSIRNPVWKISSSSPAECRLLRGTTVLRDWAACGTSYAADLFAQPDGVYILEARVVGTTAATMSRYRLDTTGPAAATIVGPPSPSTDRKPTWAVSSVDTTVHAECRVTIFTGVLKDWAPCAVSPAGSLFALDLTGLGDGTYSLLVRLTDAAGNTGPTAQSDYVLDTSAPAAVGVVAPLSPGNDTTPTWTLTSAAGVKLECRLSSGQKVISDFAPCTGEFTADLTGLPDATYTLTVHALSSAGTPGPETTSSYILDTTAAGAPGTLTGPTGPSRNRAPSWTFSLAPGTKAVCKVTFGGKVFVDGPCTSPFTLDLSNAADGTYTLTVRAVDAAGNLGAPSTAGYILKTTPPPAPVLTMQPGSPSSTTDPTWGFSLSRGTAAQCRLMQFGNPLEDWTACGTAGATNGTVTALLSGKPDGRYSMQVRAIDEAQNTSAAVAGDYVFDRSAAPLAVFIDTPPTPGNDLTPTWVVAAPPADTTPTSTPTSTPTTATTAALVRAAALTGAPQTECRLTSPRGVGAWATCSGKYVATTNGDGTYLLEVRAFDATGERGPASSSAYVLDTKAPAAPHLVDPMPPAVGNDAEVVWSWADDGNLVQCHLLRNGSPLGGFTACDLLYVANVGRLGEGTYTIEARAVDAAGNVSAVTSDSYRYDITPPAAPAFVNRPPARGASSSVGWTFGVPVDTHAVCVLTRNGTVISEGACAGAFTLDLRGQQPATWVLSVHLVDSAGNAGPSTSGSYTLLSAIGRGRVSGPTVNGPGAAPGGPAPGGPAAPGVVGPTKTPPGIDREQPRAGALHVPPVVKKTIKKVARVAGAIPGAVPGTDVPKAIKNVLGQTITKPQLPLALFVIVLLFLLVQNRIDRRDPKLAAAPANAEPELTFGPILRPGGATA
ncbi:MAG: large repetitive protein [Actinomycetota bacterium]|jgi:hypothetical protein|nr:large repetitive protein [Actinomycetota bacterium]